VLSTPPVFPDYLSPIESDLNRLRPIRTDLNLSGRYRTKRQGGCPLWLKKHGEIKKGRVRGLHFAPKNLLSICFQFAFNRADSKRHSEIQREQFYA
jgi:hypothetical protein